VGVSAARMKINGTQANKPPVSWNGIVKRFEVSEEKNETRKPQANYYLHPNI
jgi:hypothetical protein